MGMQRKGSTESLSGMNRREFLIGTGSLAAAGIAGYFLFFREPAICRGAPTARPRLSPDVSMAEENGIAVLRRGKGENLVVCGVNGAGSAVLKALDGRRTIKEAARAAAKGGNPLPEAEVACFVAQVGMMGFLAKPYYATLYESIEG